MTNEIDNLLSSTPIKGNYSDANIITLKGLAAVRKRPGMYIGNTHDGTDPSDGIYVLLKEVLDNSIDEFRMKNGNKIEISLSEEGKVCIRDYGRGIPQGKMADAVSILHTSGKFDSNAFQKSIGLNGVGIKAVNALSTSFIAISYREKKAKKVSFEKGILKEDFELTDSDQKNGTYIEFVPDPSIFEGFHYREEIIDDMIWNYCYLNTGLLIVFNDKKFLSKNGLVDLLNKNITSETLYPIVHMKSEDIEIAFTHTNQSREEYYSFVNGQHTIQGGTHQGAFRESFARTVKDYFGKNMEFTDIRSGLVAAIYIAVQEPEFESQTKIKLGSRNIGPNGPSVAKFIGDFIKQEVDNYLHINLSIADVIQQKIQESEKERKAIAGITKATRERTKRISLNNRKLRDCRIHFSDAEKKKNDRREESSVFITEGDSASGSITKSRDVRTQAVFSLRGKPLNTYGKSKTEVYKNEEFNLLQAALNIEESLDNLRYNKIIIATDADVDGMHIRLLIITYFLQFFPDLVKSGHIYVLQTPLFRIRDKKETIYCYTEEERVNALQKIGKKAEITRFKGLGEISPEEFKHFIGKDIRLSPVNLRKEDTIDQLLYFYMGGKNTMERQEFIINNLVIEQDTEEELLST